VAKVKPHAAEVSFTDHKLINNKNNLKRSFQKISPKLKAKYNSKRTATLISVPIQYIML
jgi:hypothetical protein